MGNSRSPGSDLARSPERRRRSWPGLVLTSLFAVVGLVALRGLRRQPAPPAPVGVPLAAPEAPAVDLVKGAPAVGQSIEPDPAKALLGATTPVESGSTVGDPAPVEPAPPAEPAPQSYLPPQPAPTRAWENVSASELLPGFGPASGAGYWDDATGQQPPPNNEPREQKPGLLTRMRAGIGEWSNRTPRSQVVLTVFGTLCVLGAIVATIVVLAL